MALFQTIDHAVPLAGEVQLNAYVKVVGFGGGKDRFTADVHWLKQSSDGELIKAQHFDVVLDLDGGNPIQQAYEYLKTLPEFEGAEDC
jgi:hypothetical protein